MIRKLESIRQKGFDAIKIIGIKEFINKATPNTFSFATYINTKEESEVKIFEKIKVKYSGGKLYLNTGKCGIVYKFHNNEEIKLLYNDATYKLTGFIISNDRIILRMDI